MVGLSGGFLNNYTKEVRVGSRFMDIPTYLKKFGFKLREKLFRLQNLIFFILLIIPNFFLNLFVLRVLNKFIFSWVLCTGSASVFDPFRSSPKFFPRRMRDNKNTFDLRSNHKYLPIYFCLAFQEALNEVIIYWKGTNEFQFSRSFNFQKHYSRISSRNM